MTENHLEPFENLFSSMTVKSISIDHSLILSTAISEQLSNAASAPLSNETCAAYRFQAEVVDSHRRHREGQTQVRWRLRIRSSDRHGDRERTSGERSK
eukprot:748673-Hanusia_phi.AAC.4